MKYQETQNFRNPFIFILLLFILALGIWGIVQQIIMGIPFGTNPAPDSALVFFALIPTLFLFFFFSMKLHTDIDEQFVRIRLTPLAKRTIKWSSIEKAYIRQYKPLLEYGGWGIRFSLRGNGVAYSVGGNMGLQLELKSGQKILVGTKNEAALSTFLEELNAKA